MKLEDLIIGNYYLCLEESVKYYIKFKGCDSFNILCYSFHIKETPNNEPIYYKHDGDSFCGINYFNSLKVSTIDISLIIDYLPDSNIDKKSYFRKQKIKSLLKI